MHKKGKSDKSTYGLWKLKEHRECDNLSNSLWGMASRAIWVPAETGFCEASLMSKDLVSANVPNCYGCAYSERTHHLPPIIATL
jgi:hypothetical protein